jgi:FdhD protein
LNAAAPFEVLQWRTGAQPQSVRDQLAVEEPLEIQIDTRPVSVTMRTPGHDEELAAGFLFSEALIRRKSEIAAIQQYPRNQAGNAINVLLQPEVAVDFTRLTRHVFASSSCGLCGKATIDAVHQHFAPVTSGLQVASSVVLTLPDKLRKAQVAFDETGGLHAAGLFSADGTLLVAREDVGRHNAVDKVLGYSLLHELSLERHILMVSGRASFEILQKSLAARIPILAAVSAPSSLAVDFAQQSGQTLVGFLRAERMNVYTHAARIVFD